MENAKKFKPAILVFAGPNGSGKSTITELIPTIGTYINADNIKSSIQCSDLEAAERATALREAAIAAHRDFTFETVLSSSRNIELLRKAKDNGYFIKCIFVLTADAQVNVARVAARVQEGGHDVPKEKIISRYTKSLAQIPTLISLCDVIHIYDNTVEPFRIYKRKHDTELFWENDIWPLARIYRLAGSEPHAEV